MTQIYTYLCFFDRSNSRINMRCQQRGQLHCPGSGAYHVIEDEELGVEEGIFSACGRHNHGPVPRVELDGLRVRSELRDAAEKQVHVPLRRLFDQVRCVYFVVFHSLDSIREKI